MLHRNYLFITVFLLGLTQNTSIFAGETFLQRIKNAFYKGIYIGTTKHKIPPKRDEDGEKEITMLPSQQGPYTAYVPDLPEEDLVASTRRIPFLHIKKEVCSTPNSEKISHNYRTMQYYLMPGDCLLATALGAAAYYGYKYYFHKSAH